MIIAVDFDGTICESAWPDIGKPIWPIIDQLKFAKEHGDKLILWTCREGDKLYEAVAWCKERGLEFDAINANLQESVERWGTAPRKVGADLYIDDKARSAQDIIDGHGHEAEWKEDGDGIYYCSFCGMPSAWGHPSLHIQTLERYCGSCGARMKNEAAGYRTPREKVRAAWIQKDKGRHQYFCAVCGGKQSYPSVWCSRCGTHMDDGAWEKRWNVIQAWKTRNPRGLIQFKTMEATGNEAQETENP